MLAAIPMVPFLEVCWPFAAPAQPASLLLQPLSDDQGRACPTLTLAPRRGGPPALLAPLVLLFKALSAVSCSRWEARAGA